MLRNRATLCEKRLFSLTVQTAHATVKPCCFIYHPACHFDPTPPMKAPSLINEMVVWGTVFKDGEIVRAVRSFPGFLLFSCVDSLRLQSQQWRRKMIGSLGLPGPSELAWPLLALVRPRCRCQSFSKCSPYKRDVPR